MKGGAPLRFLLSTVGGWVALRIAMTGAPVALAALAALIASGVIAPPAPWAGPMRIAAAAPARPLPAPHRLLPPPVRLAGAALPAALSAAAAGTPPADFAIGGSPRFAGLLLVAYSPIGAARFARSPDQAGEAFASPDPVPVAPAAGRWSGSAWLFDRGRSPRAIGPGGQLGGGQAGVRVVRRIGERLAFAARLAVPTGDLGASEAAAGLDWLPFTARIPVRASIERRVALGPRGRDAWSAYVAGGFYRAVGADLVVDGYAQGGVVGVRRRDLFADGAIRAGRRLELGRQEAVTLGAGAWGAAQPGAERLDIGPRAALSGPLGKVAATLAVEGRVRVAGAARPGSGLAVTLATDF